MNGNFDTVYFDCSDSMSLQEMVECDMQEMDFNFNDPFFTDHSFASPENLQRVSIKHERARSDITPIPGDLTNLQWLQNVSIPMEKGSSNKEQVMVDPNTALPVQWPNQQLAATVASVASQMVQARAVESKQKFTEPCTKIQSKEKAKMQEKPYPKPLFSYSCLIAMALKNSETGTLPVSEIYKFMMGKFPYFKTAPDGWKNSVRHNLSLNKAFCKLERPQGASQRKGCLWSLKPERREQMDKEIKKWKKKHTDAIKASMANPDELSISSDDFDEYSTNTVANGDHVEDKAAADAAKELFGNNLIQEIQQNEVLDWDDIISSNGLPIDPTLTTTTTQVHNTCEPLTTTVELDNAAHYYGNTNGHQEYDIQMPYISHYYSVPPPQHLHVGF